MTNKEILDMETRPLQRRGAGVPTRDNGREDAPAPIALFGAGDNAVTAHEHHQDVESLIALAAHFLRRDQSNPCGRHFGNCLDTGVFGDRLNSIGYQIH